MGNGNHTLQFKQNELAIWKLIELHYVYPSNNNELHILTHSLPQSTLVGLIIHA